MIRNITILFSILVLAGLVIPASAQLSIADHIVINEVDTNPPGDDSASPSEWVEIYNPTDLDVDVGGWKIASTTVLKQTFTIPIGTIIEPGQFYTYSYKTVWFTDANEIVELRDENGVVIDATALMSDTENDFNSWQRIYDGYDLDSAQDWKFEKSNAGSSNGEILVTKETQDIFVTISSIKPNYVFGETAVLRGHISEEVFKVQLGDFKPESITVKISGLSFSSEVLLYPDLNLDFETTLSLHPVLGINEGDYTASVTYAGATSSTSFSVGDKITELEIPEDSIFAIGTDKSQYLPGETLSISGITSKIIPFEGLKFELKNPNGIVIEKGTLYPTNGKFSGTIFLTTINPVYGTYVLTAEYSDKTTTSFDLVKDEKEDVLISLWSDKEVYGLGDVVTVTGRLNTLWISSLDLEILQTRNTALGVNDFTGGDLAFKILDLVRLEGDSSFEYSFQIPNGKERLGDYRIKVSKEIGTAIKTFIVVDDPSNFVDAREPLSLSTDKLVYNFGDKLIISGFIDNLSQSTSNMPVVNVSIKDKDGNPLTIIGDTGGGRLTTTGSSVAYDFTAIPDQSG
ncbi:MAG TPA: lamin tail domain-containing protein, partial [Nitrosopumilaceae archaeon]|nr:lamin tail domain-containing protein [Nitrosopumilaceae archaeon]